MTLDKMSHAEVLDTYFKEIGHFELAVRGVKAVVETGDTRSCVYAWVEHRSDNAREIKYFGKAGGGIAKRMREQRGGFLGASGPGSRHSLNIRVLLEEGSKIAIWVHESTFHNLFGINTFLHSSEEDILIGCLPKTCLEQSTRMET